MNLNKKLKVISFFSGCGGLDYGLKMSGMDIIWANDIEKNIEETYRKNVGDILIKDIKLIDEKAIPDADIMVAGFPCQPFSTAGKRKGVADARGTLYEECLRIIEYKQPPVVIFENVRGILSIRNEDGSSLLHSIIELLEMSGTGYNVQYKLLKASDYGVPQNRYRVIFVAFRKDLDIEYTFPEELDIEKDMLTVGHVIDVPLNTPNQNDIWELSPQSKKIVPYIKEGGSWKDIPYEHLPERLKKIRNDMKKYRAPNFYRRFSRNEINGTITAAATPENCGILHPLEDRRYSVREIARIQSFPDDFIFYGDSLSAKYKMIGNAVPPLLGKAIGESIISSLSEENIIGPKQMTLNI